jgi:hypothetical protein
MHRAGGEGHQGVEAELADPGNYGDSLLYSPRQDRARREACRRRPLALAGITVAVYPMLAVPGLLLDILDSGAAPLPQALSRLLDAAQKRRIVFEPIIEPIVLGPEADQHSGRFAVASNDDLLGLGFAQKPREIVFDLG